MNEIVSITALFYYFQYNPFLSYTIRYHIIRFTHNISGNYTINQYGDQQYANGYIKVDTNKSLTKVSKTFFPEQHTTECMKIFFTEQSAFLKMDTSQIFYELSK